MNRLCALLFLCGLLASSCHALEGEGIRGGDPAEPGEFPYQVSLEIYGNSICGAGIIDDYWVVTAGHCIVNELTKQKLFPMQIVAGVHDLKSKNTANRVVVDVDRAYVPKRFLRNVPKKHVVGDIAILKLRQSLDLASNTHLAKLQLPKDKTYAGEKAKIAGYGWQWVEIEYENGKAVENGGTNGKMRFAETKVLTNAQCSRKYFSVVPASLICAQVVQKRSADNPEGVCSGDSGGPLVYNGNTLIGVVSTSPLGCMEDQRPGVYTRVSHYVDVIRDAMKGIVKSDILTVKMP